jgi:hypothetical protein
MALENKESRGKQSTIGVKKVTDEMKRIAQEAGCELKETKGSTITIIGKVDKVAYVVRTIQALEEPKQPKPVQPPKINVDELSPAAAARADRCDVEEADTPINVDEQEDYEAAVEDEQDPFPG